MPQMNLEQAIEAGARALAPSQWEVHDRAAAEPPESREHPAEYIVAPSLEAVHRVLTAALPHILEQVARKVESHDLLHSLDGEGPGLDRAAAIIRGLAS